MADPSAAAHSHPRSGCWSAGASSHLFGGQPDADRVLRAVEAYRNADGGVGFMEPDIRTPASQPSAVLYAFEVLEEIPELKSKTTTFTTGALDWLQTITNDDGGIPFVLPTAKGWPHAPWWAPTDDPPSSLLMTAGTVAAAYRLEARRPPLAAARDRLRVERAGRPQAQRRLQLPLRRALPRRRRRPRPRRGRARRAARAHAERRHPQGRGRRGGRGAQRDRGRTAPRPRRPPALPRRAHRAPARRARRRPAATTAAGTSPGPPGTPPSPSSGAGW